MAAGGGARRNAPGALDVVGGLSHVKRVVLNFQRAGVKDLHPRVRRGRGRSEKTAARIWGNVFENRVRKKEPRCLRQSGWGFRIAENDAARFLYVRWMSRSFLPERWSDYGRVRQRWRSPVLSKQRRTSGQNPAAGCGIGTLSYRGNDGLRGAIREAHAEVEYIEVEDVGSVSPAGERKSESSGWKRNIGANCQEQE